jgi:hypothetical protein
MTTVASVGTEIGRITWRSTRNVFALSILAAFSKSGGQGEKALPHQEDVERVAEERGYDERQKGIDLPLYSPDRHQRHIIILAAGTLVGCQPMPDFVT